MNLTYVDLFQQGKTNTDDDNGNGSVASYGFGGDFLLCGDGVVKRAKTLARMIVLVKTVYMIVILMMMNQCHQ